jgi:hypothetical protein
VTRSTAAERTDIPRTEAITSAWNSPPGRRFPSPTSVAMTETRPATAQKSVITIAKRS